MKRSFVLDGKDATSKANELVADIVTTGTRRSGPFSVSTLDTLAAQHGAEIAHASVTSTSQREIYAYGYQESIPQQDLTYLYNRDPTARFICRDVPEKSWFAPPRTGNEAADRFLSRMWRKGFGRAAIEADVRHRRDGGAFVLVEGPDPLDQPLPRPASQRADQIRGWSYIEKKQVNDGETPSGNDDLAEEAKVEQVTVDFGEPHGEEQVHGSRLINFNQFGTRWWHGDGILRPIFDSLWNWRDINFGVSHRQFQGDPIVVTVDTEAGYRIDDDTTGNIQQDLTEVRSGERDSVGPVEGLEVERLGGADMEPPDWAIRGAVSRISNGTELPPSKVLASTRGVESSGEQDDVTYFGNIQTRMASFGAEVVDNLIELGKRLYVLDRSLTLPPQDEWSWPDPQYYDKREQAMIAYTEARAIETAENAGHEPRADLQRKWPVRAEPIDTESFAPTVTAKRGGDGQAQPPQGSPEGEDLSHDEERRKTRDVLEELYWSGDIRDMDMDDIQEAIMDELEDPPDE